MLTAEEKLARKRGYNRVWHARNPNYKRDWYLANRDRLRARSRVAKLRNKYDMTPRQWAALFDAQGRVCRVCGTDTPGKNLNWHTDHCHSTGRVRGILCHGCNTAIGHLNDDPALLRKAAEYIEGFTARAEFGVIDIEEFDTKSSAE